MTESFEQAKDETPKPEWIDLRCYILKEDYDILLAHATALREMLGNVCLDAEILKEFDEFIKGKG